LTSSSSPRPDTEARMKKILPLAILFALLLTACQSSSPPEDADVAILFTEGGCKLLKAPEGDFPNPIRIAARNTTNEDYGIPIVTLLEGFTKEDLEAHKSPDTPSYVGSFLGHIDPESKGDWLVEEIELKPNRENFVVCAHSKNGVLSVPIVLTP